METNKRIKILRESLGISQTEFGRRIGVSRSVINNIDSCVVAAKPLLIEQICRVYGCSEHWLRTGEGEMLVPKTEEEELAALFNSVLSENALPFKQKLIAAIAKLPDEAVKEVESFARDLVSHHED